MDGPPRTGSRYSDALDRQMSYLRIAKRSWRPGGSHIGDPTNNAFIEAGRQMMIAYPLAWGEPFWIAADLAVMLQQASETLPEWSVTGDLFPVPHGVLFFERPLRLTHAPERLGLAFGNGRPAGEPVKVDHDLLWAVSWMAMRQDPTTSAPKSVALDLSDAIQEDDAIVVTYWIEVVPEGGPEHRVNVEPLVVATWIAGKSRGGEPIERERERLGTPFEESDEYARAMSEQCEEIERIVGSVLLFMQQKILVAPRVQAERGARRRYERESTREPVVRVVELRRRVSAPREATDDAGEKRRYDRVSWFVSGHWRQQACGPRRSLRRPTWVRPYVKGKPEAPLTPPKATVWMVDR